MQEDKRLRAAFLDAEIQRKNEITDLQKQVEDIKTEVEASSIYIYFFL